MEKKQDGISRLRSFLQGDNDPDNEKEFDKIFSRYEKDQGFIDKLSEKEREKHRDKLLKSIQLAVKEKPHKGNKGHNRTIWDSPRWIRAAAAVTIFVCAGVWFVKSNVDVIESYLITEYTTKEGQRATVTLPDGSSVHLNIHSSIRYSKWFIGSFRKVYLSGEAFFRVKRDEKKPFMVIAGGAETTVLGTSFNVKAYPRLGEVTVSVATGKVRVGRAGFDLATLNPNEEILMNQATGDYKVITGINISRRVAWQEDRLVFDNARLAEVVALLHNYYNTEISIADSSLNNQTVTAEFSSGTPLKKVLKVLSIVNHLKYEEANHGIVLTHEPENK